MSKKVVVSENARLHMQLLCLFEELRRQKKQQWDRVLPFDELLFDRWENATFLKAKDNASVYHNCYIYGNVKIGQSTWIGPYTLLDGSGGALKIGSFCSVSSGVQIYTHDTVKWSLTGGRASKERGSVHIGDCCYIGPNSIITRGVRIGKHSVIGAHSMVSSDIPPNSIAFGIPAKVVGKVKIIKNKIKFVH
jgi:acetyltransferase-like isoleucine patch superfamily enzyme